MRMLVKVAAALVAAAWVMPLAAFAEQMSTLPFDYSKLAISDNDGNEFTVRDASTGGQWLFPSGDRNFYRAVSVLGHAGTGNFKSFAYVGNPSDQGEPASHATWVAPLSASGQPSAFPAKDLGVGAVKFNAASLTVQQMTTGKRGYVLTDGQNVVAWVSRDDDPQPLSVLKDMLQKYSLNTAWQIPSTAERDATPVGTGGPVSMFLRVDETMAASNPAPTSAPIMDMAKPAKPKAEGQGCKWWAATCWAKQL